MIAGRRNVENLNTKRIKGMQAHSFFVFCTYAFKRSAVFDKIFLLILAHFTFGVDFGRILL